MQIAILGAGMVGRAMAIDLASKYQVTSFDVSETALQLLTQKNNAIKTIKADLSDYNMAVLYITCRPCIFFKHINRREGCFVFKRVNSFFR